MSIIKKTSIALAMAAAFGLAVPAMAVEITGSPALPVTVANTSVDTAGDVSFGTHVALSVSLSSADTMLARTTGVNFTITLPAGVTFGTALTNADVTAGAGAGNGDWSAKVASTGPGFVIISLAPTVSNPNGLDLDGPLFTITNLSLTGATALRADGGSIGANLTVTDANSGNPVTGDASKDFTLVTSAYPLAVSYHPEDGNQTGRIDVGTGKVGFSWYGNILPATDSPEYYFGDGAIEISTIANLLDANGGDSYYTTSDASALTLTTTLTGMFGPAFSAGGGEIFLSQATYPSNFYCSGLSDDVVASIATDGMSASFTGYTLGDLGVGTHPSGGNHYYSQVCFYASGASQIAATPVSASTSSDAAATTPGSLLPLQYNGSVAFVPVFNPAANPTAQSFLRVINPSSTDGMVTIDGVDDSGTPGANSYTFMLPAGASMQVNSDDLESGNGSSTGGLGDGTGKWRLEITGQFNAMHVQSLNRNSTNGTVTDLSSEVISTGSVEYGVDRGLEYLEGMFFIP